MAVIDVEIERGAFLFLVAELLSYGPSVPFPTLAPLGERPGTEDRLISRFDWLNVPSFDPGGLPGYTPPAGTLLLKVAVRVHHVSVEELRILPTAGTTVLGNVWLLVASSKSALTVDVIAFAPDDAAGILLPHPKAVASLPLPKQLPVEILASAVVAGEDVVALRLASKPTDQPNLPPGGFLHARQQSDRGVSANWILHVPGELFADMVREQLADALAGASDVGIEDPPSASWTQQSDGNWGVSAAAGVVMVDACPGIGGEVDISADLAVSLSMSLSHDDSQIDLVLTNSVNASDWDTFRCWLGTGFVLGAALALINPFLGIGAGVQSLIAIAELIRLMAGGALHSTPTPELAGKPLTQVAGDTSWVRYTGSIPAPKNLIPVPDLGEDGMDFGPQGLERWGLAVAPTLERSTSFEPDGGELRGGDWKTSINCSHRSTDFFFTYRGISVRDVRLVNSELYGSLPVSRYLTSVAEPMGQASFEQVGLGLFLLHADHMLAGQSGWAVLHTSAGLRVFTLAPVPDWPELAIDSQRLINLFCDSQRELELVIDQQELRWVTPPPDYNFGFEPLRQWQIVLDNVRSDVSLSVNTQREKRSLLSRGDFTGGEGRIAAQLVTDAATDLVLNVSGAGDLANLVTASRWLVPIQRVNLPEGAVSFVVIGDFIAVRSARGTDAWVDLNTYQVHTEKHLPAQTDRGSGRAQARRRGDSASLPDGVVAVLHDGDLVFALPTQTISLSQSRS